MAIITASFIAGFLPVGGSWLGTGQAVSASSLPIEPASPYGVPFDSRTIDTTGGTGDGTLTLLAGQWWLGPSDNANVDTLDGTGAAAKFYVPNGACFGADGFLYVSEFGFEPNSVSFPQKTAGNCVRKINRSTGAVTTLAGLPAQAGGLVDGNSSTAKLHGCVALFPTSTGLLLAEYTNNAIRFITYGGTVSTVATGIANANGVCMTPNGTIYVARFAASGVIVRINADGSSTTIATLAYPANLLALDDDTLIVVQFTAQKVSRVTISTGNVTELTTETGPNANGIAMGNGEIFWACAGPGNNGDIVQSMSLSSPYTVTTLAGRPDQHSDADTDFHGLSCIAFDGTYLYAGEAWGCRVTKFLPT